MSAGPRGPHQGIDTDFIRESDEERIRAALQQPGVGGVEYHCFSRDEAERIRSRLTVPERLRVRFYWMAAPS